MKRRVQTETAFVASADQVATTLDPRASRTFKAHTLPMNEYEYELLKRVAEKYGQTHNGILRFALKQLDETK